MIFCLGTTTCQTHAYIRHCAAPNGLASAIIDGTTTLGLFSSSLNSGNTLILFDETGEVRPRERISGLEKAFFRSSEEGLLLIFNRLYKTTSTETEPVSLFDPDFVIRDLQWDGSHLVALAENAILASNDWGDSWRRWTPPLEEPPYGPGPAPLSLTRVAVGKSRLLACYDSGRCFLEEGAGWREFVVGPILDTTYFGDHFLAATSMGTVATIRPTGIQQMDLSPVRSLWNARFIRTGNRLFLASDRRLFEVDSTAIRLTLDLTEKIPDIIGSFLSSGANRMFWIPQFAPGNDVDSYIIDLESGKLTRFPDLAFEQFR